MLGMLSSTSSSSSSCSPRHSQQYPPPASQSQPRPLPVVRPCTGSSSRSVEIIDLTNSTNYAASISSISGGRSREVQLQGIVIAVSDVLRLAEGAAVFVQLLLQDNKDQTDQICQLMLTQSAFAKVSPVLKEDDVLLLYSPFVKSFVWKGQEHPASAGSTSAGSASAEGGSGDSGGGSSSKASCWYLVKDGEGVDLHKAEDSAILLYSLPKSVDVVSLSTYVQQLGKSSTGFSLNKECVVQGKVQAISHLGFLDVALSSALVASTPTVVRVYMTHMKCPVVNNNVGDTGSFRDVWKQVVIGVEVELRRVLYLHAQHSSGKKCFMQNGNVLHVAYTIRSSVIVKANSNASMESSKTSSISATTIWSNPSASVTLLPKEVSARSVYYHVWRCFVFSRLAQLTVASSTSSSSQAGGSTTSASIKYSKAQIDRVIYNIEEFFKLQVNTVFRVDRVVQCEFADPWFCDFHIARVQHDEDHVLTLLPHLHHIFLLHKMVKKYLQGLQSSYNHASKRMVRFDYQPYWLTMEDLLSSYVGRHLFIGKVQVDCTALEGQYVCSIVGEDLPEVASKQQTMRIQLKVFQKADGKVCESVGIDQQYWKKVIRGLLPPSASSTATLPQSCTFLAILQNPGCLVEQRPFVLSDDQLESTFSLAILVKPSDLLLIPLQVQQANGQLATSTSVANAQAPVVSVRDILSNSKTYVNSFVVLEGVVVRKILQVDSYRSTGNGISNSFPNKRPRDEEPNSSSSDKLLEEKKISVTIRDLHHADTILLYLPAHVADYWKYLSAATNKSILTCSAAMAVGSIIRLEGLQVSISEKKKLYLRFTNPTFSINTCIGLVNLELFRHMFHSMQTGHITNRMQQYIRSIDFLIPHMNILPRRKLIELNQHMLATTAMYQTRSMYQVVANVVFIRRVVASLRCRLCQGTSYKIHSIPCCIACSLVETGFLQAMDVFWEIIVAIDDGTCEANMVLEGDDAIFLLSSGQSGTLDCKQSRSLHFQAWKRIAESITKLVLQGQNGYHRFVYDPIEAQKSKGNLMQYRKTNLSHPTGEDANQQVVAVPASNEASNSSNSNANKSSNGWTILELDLEYDDSLLMQLLDDYEQSALTEFQSLTASSNIVEEAILKELAAGKLALNPSRALQLYLRAFPYSMQMLVNVGINLFATTYTPKNNNNAVTGSNSFQANTSLRHLKLQECNFYAYAYMAQFFPMTTNQYRKLELQCYHVVEILSVCQLPSSRRNNQAAPATQPPQQTVNPHQQDQLLQEGYALLKQLKEQHPPPTPPS